MRCCQLILAPRCISFPFPAVLEIARRKLEEVKEIEFPIITPLYPSSSPSPSSSRGSENLRYIIVVFVIAFVPERRRREGKGREGKGDAPQKSVWTFGATASGHAAFHQNWLLSPSDYFTYSMPPPLASGSLLCCDCMPSIVNFNFQGTERNNGVAPVLIGGFSAPLHVTPPFHFLHTRWHTAQSSLFLVVHECMFACLFGL